MCFKHTKVPFVLCNIVSLYHCPDPNQYGVIQRYKLHEVCHFLLSMSYDNVRDRKGHSTYQFAQAAIDAWRQHDLPMDRLAVSTAQSPGDQSYKNDVTQ